MTGERQALWLRQVSSGSDQQKLKARAKGHEFLFINPKTDKPYTTIKTAWNTACRLAGIEGLRIHDLRHTFGTRAAVANVPLTALRDVMGHGTIEMTMRYAHATDEGKRRVVEAVEKKNARPKKLDTKWTQGRPRSSVDCQ